MRPPVAFISYSHDSQEHKKWVMDLATRLRTSGVDAILDQWELNPGSDLPQFMERNLASADRVLMICTQRYVEKANSGSGGVGYEKMIVTADLLSSIDSKKVIPIIRQDGTYLVPTFLATKLFIDFSSPESFESNFDQLARELHGSPLFKKPAIGNNPFTPISETPTIRINDNFVRLLEILLEDYENGDNFSEYDSVRRRWEGTRLLLDVTIDQALKNGMIGLDQDGDILLTPQSRHFALNQLKKNKED